MLSAAVVATFGLAPSGAVATFPGENGLIAYVDYDLDKLRTIQPDGTGAKSITEGSSPAWSATGRRIVFTRSVDWDPRHPAHIFTIRPDGADKRHVTWGYTPSFSPGGGRIVFTRYIHRLPPPTIYTARVKDGSHQRRLVRGLSPAWSPDGDLIAYWRQHSENERRDGIWTMRPDGTHQRQLTRAPGGWFDHSPDFSPNGRWIVFSREEYFDDAEVLSVRSRRPGELKSVPCVSNNPSYSPDGKGFVSQSFPGRYVQYPIRIHVTYPGCPARVLPTSGELGNGSPSWQPLPEG